MVDQYQNAKISQVLDGATVSSDGLRVQQATAIQSKMSIIPPLIETCRTLVNIGKQVYDGRWAHLGRNEMKFTIGDTKNLELGKVEIDQRVQPILVYPGCLDYGLIIQKGESGKSIEKRKVSIEVQGVVSRRKMDPFQVNSSDSHSLTKKNT